MLYAIDATEVLAIEASVQEAISIEPMVENSQSDLTPSPQIPEVVPISASEPVVTSIFESSISESSAEVGLPISPDRSVPVAIVSDISWPLQTLMFYPWKMWMKN